MKIAIDARWISRDQSGIGTYSLALLDALAVQDRENEYVVLVTDPEQERQVVSSTRIAQAPNFRTRRMSGSVFSLRSQLTLPTYLRREPIHVFHSPNYMIPLLAFPRRRPHRTRCIVTLHDVIPLVSPQFAPRARKNRVYPLFRWLMREIGRRADRVLTVSHCSRRDILAHLGLPPDAGSKITVVPNGVASCFRPADRLPPSDPSRLRTILYVGRHDPYKNVGLLVRALRILKERVPFPVRLILAGAKDPRYPETAQLAEREGVVHDVIWAGQQDTQHLVRLYQQADVLAHPSRYEGFGLPVLEAMACGLPVVCSNAASLPEVTGDAAVLLDPDDLPGWVEAMERVLTDTTWAASLRERGRQRAAAYSWSRTAAQTLAIYQEEARHVLP